MNCKRGDLALVVRIQANFEEHEFLLGTTVVVRYLANFGMSITSGSGFNVINLLTEPVWIVDHRSGEYMFRDSSLKPIRPGDLDETTDTDMKLKVTA